MSRRKGGLFLPLDVNFMDDPLIDAVGEKAAWLYLAMCLRSKALMSDGRLTRRQVEKLGVVGWQKRLDALLYTKLPGDEVKALIWQLEPGTYWIVGWDYHNDRADTVEERREKDRLRKQRDRTSEPNPVGVPTESGSQVEKSREEYSVRADKPCGHGATDSSRCALCRSSLRSVSA